jgi:hypothetical protein
LKFLRKGVFLTPILFLSCVTPVAQKLDPLIYYKRSSQIEVNGKKGSGILVVPRAEKYKIRIKTGAKMDLQILKTCHREEESEGLGRTEKFYFTPNKGIEDVGDCHLRIATLEYGKGRHSFALIDFENPQMFNLRANVRCSGKNWTSNGVTVCQAKQGLWQEIEFEEEVQLHPDLQAGRISLSNAKCEVFLGKFKKLRYKASNRECGYVFRSDSGRRHKLTSVGYEELLLKGL